MIITSNIFKEKYHKDSNQIYKFK